jgi:hypothetical protein
MSILFNIPDPVWSASAPQGIYGGWAQWPTLVPLQDGGFMAIYDKWTTEETAEIRTFSSTGVPDETSTLTNYGVNHPFGAATLSNGNVVMAFRDNYLNDNHGYFRIFDSDTGDVKTITEFSDGQDCKVFNPPVVPLTNGNFMIIWGRDRDTLETVVYNAAGTSVINRELYVQDIYIDFIDAVPHGSGALLGFCGYDVDKMQWAYLDSTGVITSGPNLIGGTTDQAPVCGEFLNGNLFFGWYKGNPTYDHVYEIRDSGGGVVKAAATMYDGNQWATCAVQLSDGGMMVLGKKSSGNITAHFFSDDGTEGQVLILGVDTGGIPDWQPFKGACQLNNGNIVAYAASHGAAGNFSIINYG